MTRSGVDLDAYCARIGYHGERSPTLAVLTAVQAAQQAIVPFENLDTLHGIPLALDPAALWTKLVHQQRGGNCFELHLLLADALEAMGFTVVPLAARVRLGAVRPRARTHMVLQVMVPDGPYLVDVGFAGPGPLLPIPLQDGHVAKQGADQFRLCQEHGQWVLAGDLHAGWWEILPFGWPEIGEPRRLDLFEVAPAPQVRADFEMACFYATNHPAILRSQGLMVQTVSPERRLLLRNHMLVELVPGKVTVRALESPAELRQVLAESFGLTVPADSPPLQRMFAT